MAHNFNHFVIYLPKITKIDENLTKFWQKQFCTTFSETRCVYDQRYKNGLHVKTLEYEYYTYFHLLQSDTNILVLSHVLTKLWMVVCIRSLEIGNLGKTDWKLIDLPGWYEMKIW